ncbi:hypothetical protein CSOJ01_13161 [Colletotrichum sojae]|uniref:Uncharacterized protein n=1 Tax=Colletotrichum sojae TaxID=2175907 RepID=A0A8H6ITG2_9PEZI|nr:hypothetical protein CSOJ01_13161 [Colletotrichum sojae]
MFVSKDWMICTALPYQPTSPISMFPRLLWRFNRQRRWPQIDWLRNCVYSTSNGAAADGNRPDHWTLTVPYPAPRRAGTARPVAARTGPRGGYRDLPVVFYVLISSVPCHTQAIQHLHHHANASACMSTNSVMRGLLLASVVPEGDGRMSPSKRKHLSYPCRYTARHLVSAPANNLQRPVLRGPLAMSHAVARRNMSDRVVKLRKACDMSRQDACFHGTVRRRRGVPLSSDVADGIRAGREDAPRVVSK